MTERWREVWREAFAPQMSDGALWALARGLGSDDPRILQGATTSPPPLQCVQDWPVEAADPLVYAWWQGDRNGQATVAEAEERFAAVCFKADETLAEPAGCRHFLNWCDETPRQGMRASLLGEVMRELDRRRSVGSGAGGGNTPPDVPGG